MLPIRGTLWYFQEYYNMEGREDNMSRNLFFVFILN